LRLMDSCITELKVQGPCRTCNESKEEEGCALQGRAKLGCLARARAKRKQARKKGRLPWWPWHSCPLRPSCSRDGRAIAGQPLLRATPQCRTPGDRPSWRDPSCHPRSPRPPRAAATEAAPPHGLTPEQHGSPRSLAPAWRDPSRGSQGQGRAARVPPGRACSP